MTTHAAVSDVGRYQLLGLLGEGAFSTVYDAQDRATGERVALKQLSRTGPSALARFKQEFRAVQGIHHPNLVELRELFEQDGAWFIAMERVQGVNLLEHLRGGRSAAFDSAQLHRVFAQLTRALMALHERAVVHRDLKPRNVLVTPQERVVLLDFGLIEVLGAQRGNSLAGVGTLEYMAPEQVVGGPLEPAADFYALGVCLYEALAGRTVFAGKQAREIALLKTQHMPASPTAHNPGAPAKLAALCMRLLEIDPARRPGAADILSVLDPQARPASRVPPAASSLQFAGRAHELELLSHSLARSFGGEFALVVVEGESGIGKSALVSEFTQRVQREHADGLLLRARCYENELLAFKAFDGAIEELVRHLAALTPAEQAALLPAQAALLPRLFAAFRALPVLASVGDAGVPADPAAQRVAALQALLQLLCNVGRRQRLVIEIDDLQWADADSFRLLHMLAHAPQRPSLLLVATARAGCELSQDAAEQIARVQALPGAQRLLLRGLSLPDTAGLAARLLGAQASETLLDALVAESQGHPLLLAELVQYTTTLAGSTTLRRLTLDQALRARMAALSPPALRLLVTVAIAGRPYPSSVLGRALDMPEDELSALCGQLLVVQLLRRRGGHELACYHDRIREVAQDLLGEQDRRALHLALAAALARQPVPDLAEVARHYDAAGELRAATDAYARSAELALAGLAFARAEQLCSRALALAPACEAQQPELLARLMLTRGHALSRAGRGLEAAEQYLQAAQAAQGESQQQLRILSAQHLLQGMRISEGMSAARALLAELGVPLPSSAFGMWMRGSWDELALRWTPSGDARSGAAPPQGRIRLQLDTLWAFANAVGWFDPQAHRAIMLRHGRIARARGDPSHRTRALAEEALRRCRSAPGNPQSARLIADARTLCDELSDPELDVVVSWREAMLASLQRQHARQQERLEHALEVATRQCPTQPRLFMFLRVYLGNCWDRSGAHARLASEATRWLEEAVARDDQAAVALLEGVGAAFVRKLMIGDFDDALAVVAAALRALPPEPFGLPQWGELFAVVQIELCRGGAGAHRWLQERQAQHARAQLLRGGFIRDRLLTFRANAALAACQGSRGTDTQTLLREVSAYAARLQALRQHGDALRLRAQLAALAGDTGAALRDIQLVRAGTERASLFQTARAEQYLEGLIEGGDNGTAKRREALAFFREQGWREPLRAVARVCPCVDLLT